MRCEVEVVKTPPDMHISYEKITIRERALRYLLGEKTQAAVIVPGSAVKKFIFVSERPDDSGERREKSCQKENL